jgi:hypothetical protein
MRAEGRHERCKGRDKGSAGQKGAEYRVTFERLKLASTPNQCDISTQIFGFIYKHLFSNEVQVELDSGGMRILLIF